MLTAGCWGRPQPEDGDNMSQRYTAVFEWEGEAPSVTAKDGWLGGRLVRLSLEEEPVGDGDRAIPLTNSELFEAIQRGLDDLRIQAAHRDLHEVVINDVVYRTTNKKLVEEIQRQDLEIQEMNGRLIAANRTLQNVRGQLGTAQNNAAVYRRQRAALTADEAYVVVTKTAPWTGSTSDVVQRLVEIADEVRAARTDGREHLSGLLEPAVTAPAPDVATLEEEHRYLSSALLSRCGPRAIGETWVHYARRCMGQS